MTPTNTGYPEIPATPPSAGEISALPSFTWTVRVYYEDTDAGGVVYYANYLRFFERCRTEWMRALGFGQQEMAKRDGVLFVVAAADVRYLRSARLDDELVVDARIAERFGSYVVFEQTARRGREVLCSSRMKVACVDAQSMRPTRLPAALVARLVPPDGAAQQAGARE
jgi:acyl-CoA thioester hydrolase